MKAKTTTKRIPKAKLVKNYIQALEQLHDTVHEHRGLSSKDTERMYVNLTTKKIRKRLDHKSKKRIRRASKTKKRHRLLKKLRRK